MIDLGATKTRTTILDSGLAICLSGITSPATNVIMYIYIYMSEYIWVRGIYEFVRRCGYILGAWVCGDGIFACDNTTKLIDDYYYEPCIGQAPHR